jgi:hypothetical protein
MLPLKRTLGVVAIAAAALLGHTVSASAAPATANAWVFVGSYFTEAWCKDAGEYYADGSTGYYCEHRSNPYRWDLYVGP